MSDNGCLRWAKHLLCIWFVLVGGVVFLLDWKVSHLQMADLIKGQVSNMTDMLEVFSSSASPPDPAPASEFYPAKLKRPRSNATTDMLEVFSSSASAPDPAPASELYPAKLKRPRPTATQGGPEAGPASAQAQHEEPSPTAIDDEQHEEHEETRSTRSTRSRGARGAESASPMTSAPEAVPTADGAVGLLITSSSQKQLLQQLQQGRQEMRQPQQQLQQQQPQLPAKRPLATRVNAKGKYHAVIHARGQECGEQKANLGEIPTLEKCDALAAASASCGDTFMFSVRHPNWACRCCAEGGGDGGSAHPDWDVYKTQSPKPKQLPDDSAGKQGSAVDSVQEGGVSLTGEIRSKGSECKEQGVNFGQVSIPADCDNMVALTKECGSVFMFSKDHPEWACRCCTPSGADNGPRSPQWTLYNLQTPRPEVFPGIPTLPRFEDPFRGLPVAEGPRPHWLVREDELVVDARPRDRGGGMLIIMAVLMDANSAWGKQGGLRPHWLRAILATNRAHARRHGHAMILRAQPTQPQLTLSEWRQCGMKDVSGCVKRNERENYNWEKHLMISDYLLSPENFTHVLMLDADAALVHPEHNTLRRIADILDDRGKNIFLTDEDWLQGGEGTINGGLVFMKNADFTKGCFQDTFEAHLKGSEKLKNWRIGISEMECSSNEQICLNDLWKGKGKPEFAPHAMMASGRVYNRGAERGGERYLGSPSVEVMHWMGGSKASAGTALCRSSHDFTGEGPNGYGCKMK